MNPSKCPSQGPPSHSQIYVTIYKVTICLTLGPGSPFPSGPISPCTPGTPGSPYDDRKNVHLQIFFFVCYALKMRVIKFL